MSRRSSDWNELLREQLEDREFAIAFIQELMEEDGLTIKEAMAQIIRSYGVKEYAELTGLQSASISRALNSEKDFSNNMLKKLLFPLGLEPKISVGLRNERIRPGASRFKPRAGSHGGAHTGTSA